MPQSKRPKFYSETLKAVVSFIRYASNCKGLVLPCSVLDRFANPLNYFVWICPLIYNKVLTNLCVYMYFVSLSQTGKMQLDQQVDILALQGHLIS